MSGAAEIRSQCIMERIPRASSSEDHSSFRILHRDRQFVLPKMLGMRAYTHEECKRRIPARSAAGCVQDRI